ncbi:MAG: NTP transferase domain-containing protein [Methylophilaceae bacterium]
MTEVLILAGGFGKRLGELTKKIPKPMIVINGKPFLEILIDNLTKKKINRIILSVGYKHQLIQNYFGNSFNNIEIDYSIEKKPLGTGGAIVNSFKKIKSENFLVLNGDTFIEFNLEKFIANFYLHNKPIIYSTLVESSSRYGSLSISDGKLLGFNEKNNAGTGYINAGIYFFRKADFDGVFEKIFSIEDWIANNIKLLNMNVITSSNPFIDIGVPEDLIKASNFFRLHR